MVCTCKSWSEHLEENPARSVKGSSSSVQYTNHSLRATAITRMYEGGIPENLISEKSGHKSIKALRCYESTSAQQEKVAGLMISGEASSGDHSVMPTLSLAPRMLPNPKFQGPTMPASEAHRQDMSTFSRLNNCTFNFDSK